MDDMVDCPVCGLPGEVVKRYLAGDVVMVEVACLSNSLYAPEHWTVAPEARFEALQ